MNNEQITGCWQMVEAWNVNDPSKPNDKTYPWGRPPLGYWVYDPAGNVSVQISINPPLPNVDLSSWWTLDVNASMTESFNNYMAYFGTYTVDYATGTVVHNVTTDVLRTYTGTEQPRPFKFVDGDLVIGDGQSYMRRFKRVASFGAA